MEFAKILAGEYLWETLVRIRFLGFMSYVNGCHSSILPKIDQKQYHMLGLK